jgi:serine/threonine protein kinase
LDGRYLLTGNTGSLRYMAPEVALNDPYTYTVDSYSFGIIFWQICSLTTPFAGYSEKMHAERVVQAGERPRPDPTWPMAWVEIMQRCWDPNPEARPGFDAVVESVEHRYYELEQDDEVLPTRTYGIRAKTRKPKVPDHDHLDVDTRIAGTDPVPSGGGGAPPIGSKRVDGDIV